MLVNSATRTREEYYSHLRVVSLMLACKRDVALNLYRISEMQKCYVQLCSFM